jgi:hypothetical protein
LSRGAGRVCLAWHGLSRLRPVLRLCAGRICRIAGSWLVVGTRLLAAVPRTRRHSQGRQTHRVAWLDSSHRGACVNV